MRAKHVLNHAETLIQLKDTYTWARQLEEGIFTYKNVNLAHQNTTILSTHYTPVVPCTKVATKGKLYFNIVINFYGQIYQSFSLINHAPSLRLQNIYMK